MKSTPSLVPGLGSGPCGSSRRQDLGHWALRTCIQAFRARAWVPEGTSLEWEGTPTLAYKWECPGREGLLSGSEKGASVYADGLGQEGESSMMVLLVTEKTVRSYETLHGTSSCQVRFWERGPTVAGGEGIREIGFIIRNWLGKFWM